jgi:hypothetical protein
VLFRSGQMPGALGQVSIPEIMVRLSQLMPGGGTPPTNQPLSTQAQLARAQTGQSRALAAQAEGATNAARGAFGRNVGGLGMLGAGLALEQTAPYWQPYAEAGIEGVKDYGRQALAGLRAALGR